MSRGLHRPDDFWVRALDRSRHREAGDCTLMQTARRRRAVNQRAKTARTQRGKTGSRAAHCVSSSGIDSRGGAGARAPVIETGVRKRL